MDERLKSLYWQIRKLEGGVVVAFSGGIDSALLLRTCADLLGDRVLAVTADSPSFPETDRRDAKRLAQEFGVRQLVVQTNEMQNESYRKNGLDRCYHCKHTLFETLRPIAARLGLRHLAFGANLDDQADFRPGHRAAQEFHVHAPLHEAGLSKQDVRELSRQLGISIWDKPGSACLSSRVPFGTAIDARTLNRIEAAESVLRRMGYTQCRVRHYGETARLEFVGEQIAQAAGRDRAEIERQLIGLGYREVVVDPAGYRSGSLNPPRVMNTRT